MLILKIQLIRLAIGNIPENYFETLIFFQASKLQGFSHGYPFFLFKKCSRMKLKQNISIKQFNIQNRLEIA